MARRYHNENFRSLLNDFNDRVVQAAKEGLRDNADLLVEEAKNRCPVDTGRLKNSIHAEVVGNGFKVRVVADATNDRGFFYAPIVEYSPKINKPFMYPALDAKRQEMHDHLIDKIRLVVRQS